MLHKGLKNKGLSLALLLSLAVPFNAQAADTIKIGVQTALSGDLAAYGIPSLRASEIAVEELNKKGGLLGKQVELVIADDQCKSELAPNAASSLLSQDVVAVVGALCSGTTKAAVPLYTEANVIFMSPASSTPDLTLDEGNPTFFRTIGHDFTQGAIAADFIGQELKPKKIAFLNDNGEYGKSFSEVTRDNIKKKYPEIEVVIFESVTLGASDYSASIRKLRREGAEVLVWGGYHPEASKIANTIADFDLDIAIVGSDSLRDKVYIETAGEAGYNTYASAPSDTSNYPLSIEAAKAHEAKFNQAPGVFYDNAYAATVAILNAIEKAGTTDTDKVMKALRTENVDTPLGVISFDENGDAKGIGMSMYKVQNGEFVSVFEQ